MMSFSTLFSKLWAFLSDELKDINERS